jgi:hypothetical protein
MNLIGNDGGKFALGFVSSLKIPTNTDKLGNSVYEPGFGLPFNYALPGGFTLFGQTRLDILDRAQSRDRRVLWSNPIGVSRTLYGPVSGYLEFYDAVGLIYQVSENFSVDINSFFGLTRSADDVNVFVGFARRF